jgi:energy-coupling factor transporter ATP-binding protein EcfA2
MSPALTAWLGQQHLWLQIAANRLTRNGQLTDADIADLANIIKDPTIALDTQLGTPTTPQTTADAGELRLMEIGPIEGIDALSPRTPLNLGNRNLVVVYGHNGSGKSGYTRIISRACGKPYAGALKSNVFAPAPPRQMCKIKYSVDGVETEVEWTPTSSIGALTSLDVFDTDSGRIYLENETEATFLPPDLSFIADLVTACNRVESVLIAGEQRLVSALPSVDAALYATTAITAARFLINDLTEQVITLRSAG